MSGISSSGGIPSPLPTSPSTSNIPAQDVTFIASAVTIAAAGVGYTYAWNMGANFPTASIWIKFTGTNEANSVAINVQGCYVNSSVDADWVNLKSFGSDGTPTDLVYNGYTEAATSGYTQIPITQYATYIRLKMTNNKAHTVTVYAYGMGKLA